MKPFIGQRRWGQRRGGYVLIMVLVVLLVLSLLVAGLYSASEDSRFTAQSIMSQRVAASRADQAAQLAIATVRANVVPPTGMAYCSGPPAKLSSGSCTTSDFVTSGLVQGPTSGDLETGSGLRYQWWVFKLAGPDGGAPNQAAQIFNIYAEGYYGYTDTSPNFAVAAVTAEITIPLPPGMNPCEYDYSCPH